MKASVTDNCGHAVDVERQIYTGVPNLGTLSFSNSANEDAVWCSSHIRNYFSHDNYPLSDITGYQSRLLSFPSMSLISTNNHANPEAPDPHGYVPTGWYIFELRATNACGTSEWIANEVESMNCSNEFFKLMVSPNPVKGTATLTIIDEVSGRTSLNKRGSFGVDLRNLQTGARKKHWALKNDRSTYNLDFSDVGKGMYLITVTRGTRSQSVKI